MCTISLKNIIQGQSFPDAGDALFKMMVAKLNDGETILLDMTGVPSLPSLFLNPSVGRFIEENGADLLKEKVKFAHISKMQADRLNEYIRKLEK